MGLKKLQALYGIKVLDLTRLLPGPYCTMILADFGANVIKVEQPLTGDYAREYEPLFQGMGYRHIILNRNKKSLTLDLKKTVGKEIFGKLVKNADIIIESFRPGVAEKLEIDYKTMKKINPKIIYCSLSGYGQTGPLKMEAGHDLNYVSLAGILSLTGEKNGKPYIPGVQLADLSSGLLALNGILMALLAREMKGIGQYIDISMHDSALSFLPSDASHYFGAEQVTRRGESRLTGALPNYAIYQTKDDNYMAVGSLESKFWKNLCCAIGRKDLIEAIEHPENRQSIFAELETIFKGKSMKEWEVILKGKDTCVTPVYDLDEVFNQPQVKAREMVVELDDPKLGKHRQLGIPIKLSETPGTIRFSAPKLGEHNKEILLETGYTDEEIHRFKTDKII